MKYRIHKSLVDESFDVITEDGGIASVYHNGENITTNYYQLRLTDIDKDEYLWDALSCAKIYYRDWDDGVGNDEIVNDALNWLVFPSPKNWELDNTIFQDIFNDDI
jgi:hypothetical protein